MEGHLQPNQKQRCLHEMDVLQHHPVPIACALVDGIDSNLMCGQTREVCLQGMVLYRGTCVCSSLAQAAGLPAFSCPWPMEMLWRLPAACSDIEKRKRQAQCGVDVVQQRARTNSMRGSCRGTHCRLLQQLKAQDPEKRILNRTGLCSQALPASSRTPPLLLR